MNLRSELSPIPKVLEALPRWKVFPREILFDLSHYHHRHIKEWHTGEMSSNELLNLLDGLMLHEHSWYRISVELFIEELKEEEERLHRQHAHNLIFAQLMGQGMGGSR